MNSCEICGNSENNNIHSIKEMMFGTRHKFDYLECGHCGCLQLMSPPENIADYYPQNYYSYQTHGRFMTFLRRRWAAWACGKFSLIGWFISELFFPNNAMRAVHKLSLPKNAEILEFGSGSGRLLLDLQHMGYSNVAGADPFIGNDIHYSGGLKIRKCSVEKITGKYDLVMLHHAFEHMPSPQQTLINIASLLNAKGKILLRIPIASSYGWQMYGINWVHLDAPRHFFLHTLKSIELMSCRANLVIDEVVHESEEISITGSESYARDVPLMDKNYPLHSTRDRLFSWFSRYRAKKIAEKINRNKNADLCCFYLKKK
jgi:2-polyprenyl-3-methyl-5-hydroxy-6-metoxy-1,4-benzoquinol methylase